MIEMRERLAAKLRPGIINTSAKFTAVLGYILDESWTEPEIVTIEIAADDTLIVTTNANGGEEQIEGLGADLWRNLYGIADAAGLTKEEKDALVARAKRKVTDWTITH